MSFKDDVLLSFTSGDSTIENVIQKNVEKKTVCASLHSNYKMNVDNFDTSKITDIPNV